MTSFIANHITQGLDLSNILFAFCSQNNGRVIQIQCQLHLNNISCLFEQLFGMQLKKVVEEVLQQV